MKRLTDYDCILLNSSGGKDSLAMCHYIVGRCTKLGIQDRCIMVHCDLGRVEWQGTRELAEEHARHFGIRFEVVKREQDLLDHVEERGMWPGPQTRYCTSDHKRGQVHKLITRLTLELAPYRSWKPKFLNCLGLRAEESPGRAKKPVFAVTPKLDNSRRHCYDWLPIHDWTERQVWDAVKSSGARVHPAYALGMPRLSCCFCIFAPPGALMLSAKHNPELFQEYLAVEKRIGHTFRPELSLQMIDERMRAGEQIGTLSGAWNM